MGCGIHSIMGYDIRYQMWGAFREGMEYLRIHTSLRTREYSIWGISGGCPDGVINGVLSGVHSGCWIERVFGPSEHIPN